MSNRQYIGARYVPKFYDGNNNNIWDSGVSYEPLTVVTYLNDSYTSKIPVPSSIGNPADNPEYWCHTGAYNAQVEQYRQEVIELNDDVDELTESYDAVKDGKKSITFLNTNYFYPYETSAYTGNEETCSILQGGVLTNNGDNIVIGLINDNDTGGILKEYKLSDGSLIRSGSFAAYGHLNSLAFDGVYLYANYTNNQVVVINYTDFSISEIKTITMPANVTGFFSIDYVDEKFYLSNKNVIAIYDDDFVLQNVIELDYKSFSGDDIETYQNIKYYNGFYYGISYESNALYKFNANGELENASYLKGTTVYLGEPEFIVFKDDKFIIGSIFSTSRNAIRRYALLSFGNMAGVVRGSESYNSGYAQYSFLQLKCDAETNNVYMNGTSTYPYKDISLALSHLSNSSYNWGRITLATGDYLPFETCIKPFSIISENTSSPATIKGAIIGANTNATFSYIDFETSNMEFFNDYDNCCVGTTGNVGKGCVNFNNCNFTSSGTGVYFDNVANICMTYCDFTNTKRGAYILKANFTERYCTHNNATLDQTTYSLFEVIECNNNMPDMDTYYCIFGGANTSPYKIPLFTGDATNGAIDLNVNKRYMSWDKAYLIIEFYIDDQDGVICTQYVAKANQSTHLNQTRIYDNSTTHVYDVYLNYSGAEHSLTIDYNKCLVNGVIDDTKMIHISKIKLGFGN